MKLKTAVIGLSVLAGLVQARGLDTGHDSLPPSVRWYLEQREKTDWFLQDKPFGEYSRLPDSQGLRLVGKWGRGPANRITGRDTVAFMSLGSEVAIFNVADGSNPRIISEIQCRNITGRLALKDSFLFVGATGPVEVWSIANLRQPRFICYAPVAGADLAIGDSLCYVLGIESLYIFNVTNSANFQRLGACRDSGFALNVVDQFAYLCDRWGLYVIDARDPTNPTRASTIAGGTEVGASWAEGQYCYYTVTYPSSSFRIANISDPYHPTEVGHIDNIAGYDVHKMSFFAYVPGYWIIDVSQPGTPAIVGGLSLTGNGVWTKSPYTHGFLAANYSGLGAINITDPVHPAIDTTVAAGDRAYDVKQSTDLAVVADVFSGLRFLDIGNPALPHEVGAYDSVGSGREFLAAALGDSYAYTGSFDFRTVDVSSPAFPRLIGWTSSPEQAEAMVLRDSLVYVAEDYRLEIFSVANPRSPRLVGSCGLPSGSSGICLVDSLAFLASAPIEVIDIRDPAHPVPIASVPIGDAYNVTTQDSFLYAADNYGGLEIWNIADLRAPYFVDSIYYPRGYDVVAADSLLFFGGLDLRVLRLDNPAHPTEIGHYTTPYRVKRLYWNAPHIYAACFGAGVCILETTSQSGVGEYGPGPTPERRLELSPNPSSGEFRLTADLKSTSFALLQVYDASGRVVKTEQLQGRQDRVRQSLDLNNLPDGCYFVRVKTRDEGLEGKMVKTTRR